MKLSERIEMVRAHAKQVLEAAGQRYNLDTSKVTIRFDLRGRSAGMAGCRIVLGGGTIGHYIRFNVDMINGVGFKHVLESTVPHEVAHIICYMNPKLGKDHNAGWRWVCRSLGGTGETHHNEEVVYAKGTTYTYITTLGHKINLSQQRHRKIQNGHIYTVRGRGMLTKSCEWSRYVATAETAQPVIDMPAAPVVNVPAVEAPAKKKVAASNPVAKTAGTNADKVRAMIAAAKKAGHEQDVVVAQAVEKLGMTKSLAKSYVKNNWERV